MSNIKSLENILKINKGSYSVVFIYSIAVSILSLVIPIGAQSLVNVVSFGTLLQPIVILSLMVLFILSIVAAIRIAQAYVVETIQQRIFVHIGIKLSEILPNIEFTNFDKFRVSDLVNRFFEIQTIQKALAIFLVTGIEIILLSVFSMVLIAFYHPLLLAFDIVLILALLLVLWLPWHGALTYAKKECEAKHSLASWLEEIVHNILLFKMQNHRHYAIKEADNRIVAYLEARKRHFKYFIRHIIGMNAIYVFANATLLGIGGFLVIQEQLSLGQLVASELVVNALLYGFVRFSYYLEDFYDLLASTDKLEQLLAIKCENPSTKSKYKHIISSGSFSEAPSISVKNLYFNLHTNTPILEDVSFEISPGDHSILLGKKGSGKSLLIDLILGLRSPRDGVLKINSVPVKEYNLELIRKNAALVRSIELFSGTIIDNLVMHRSDIEPARIHALIEKFGLSDLIAKLPNGLDTYISGSHHAFTYSTLMKMMMIRALLTEPYLLIIDGVLDLLEEGDLIMILNMLDEVQATMLIATQRIEIGQRFTKCISL